MSEFVKFWRIVLVMLLAFGAGLAQSTRAEDCDNEDPPDCDEEDECDCDSQDGSNRFDVYSANVKRPIEDMRAAVKIGEHPLVFGRHHSR